MSRWWDHLGTHTDTHFFHSSKKWMSMSPVADRWVSASQSPISLISDSIIVNHPWPHLVNHGCHHKFGDHHRLIVFFVFFSLFIQMVFFFVKNNINKYIVWIRSSISSTKRSHYHVNKNQTTKNTLSDWSLKIINFSLGKVQLNEDNSSTAKKIICKNY